MISQDAVPWVLPITVTAVAVLVVKSGYLKLIIYSPRQIKSYGFAKSCRLFVIQRFRPRPVKTDEGSETECPHV